jgi:WD40 repeat protein
MKPLKIGTSHAVAFSKDGELLATLGQDVWIWNLASRSKTVRVHPFSHPSYAVFSPDQRSITVKNTSGRIVIVEVQSGRTIVDFNNAGDGEGSNLLYSPCGEFILDGTWAGRLSVRRASSGAREFVQDFQGETIGSVHSCGNGRRWIVAHGLKEMADDRPPPPDYFSVWEWPFRTGEYTLLPEKISFSRSSALSNDGKLLAVIHGAPPDTLSVLQLSDGACIGTTDVQAGGTGSALSWSPDGRLIASVQDGLIVFYAWPGLTTMHKLPLAYACDVAFSARGGWLALGSWEAGWVLAAEAITTASLSLLPPRSG